MEKENLKLTSKISSLITVCISDDQGFSFLVHNTIKLCQEQILTASSFLFRHYPTFHMFAMAV
jgi:hypothetical protein